MLIEIAVLQVSFIIKMASEACMVRLIVLEVVNR